jgi:S1-C subfamily serine protease
MGTVSPARMRLLAAAVAAAAPLLLAGCTGSGGHAGASSPGTASSSPPAASSATSPASSGSGSTGAALALQAAYVKVVHDVRPSVVQITTSSGLGSGVIYDTKGDIVTNDHVVGNARTVTVQFISGTKTTGTVVGTFPGDDLAVVRVSGVSAKDLHPASFADSAKLQAGDIVLAIGNPLAYQSSVTSGIISAVGRTVTEPKSGPSPGGVIANAIQTSAPINPGNSGGALVDLNSRVVGIPTLSAVDPEIGGEAVGIGFAIPSSTVTDIASQIIRYGRVVNSHKADLGVYSYPAATLTGQPIGVAVAGLLPNSPAGKAGIKPGDVITGINGTPVKTESDLQSALAQLKPGQTVPVTIVRPDGSTATVKVTLGTLPG